MEDKFAIQLEKLYQENNSFKETVIPKLEFIGESIFNFTCYDSFAAELFAKNMIEVIECILTKTQFLYQEENYMNYLTMVNIPFLVDKIDWGTSIRAAWFDEWKQYEIASIKVSKGEIYKFLQSLINWSKI